MEVSLQAVWGGFVASIVWFIIGGALYMNPVIARIYKTFDDVPVMKQWPDVPRYLFLMYAGTLAQCVLWAFVYIWVKPVLPDSIVGIGVVFGLMLVATKIFPRFFDMWIQTTYPNKLLGIELINGSIGSIVIAVVFAFMI